MKTPLESNTLRNVGIWVRVSSEDQAKGESPLIHEKRARFYAESKAWPVKTIYDLSGVSGKSVIEHPECIRMLEDVRSGKIKALIFSKLARLARNTKELLEFSDIFRQANCDLISLQESIDTSTPSGRLFYTMIAAMAQWEREEIADRVRSSFATRAKMGKPLNAKAPFGYRYEKRELVPDPAEVPIRKLIYELFIETKRIRTVATRLNDAGHRTREGHKFGFSTVKRLIKNPTAKGVHIVNHTGNGGKRGNRVPKPEEEWVYRTVEPIITEELWNEANQILDARADEYKRPGPRPVHLFSGLTYCHCGQRMYPRVNSPKYICSRCKNKIAIEVLEGIFYEQLKGFSLSGDEIRASLKKASDSTADKRVQLDAHVKELDKVKSEIDRLYRSFQSNELQGAAFGRFYDTLAAREKELENELPRLQAEIDVLQIDQFSSETVVSEAADLYARWPNLTFDEKRPIVETITERIDVTKDSVNVTLCYLPLLIDDKKAPQRVGCGILFATTQQRLWLPHRCPRLGLQMATNHLALLARSKRLQRRGLRSRTDKIRKPFGRTFWRNRSRKKPHQNSNEKNPKTSCLIPSEVN